MAKKLRDLYMKDPAARKFLKEHPEFDDRFLEQTEVNMPGFNQTEGKYTLTEVDESRREYGELMLEAFNALPESHKKRPILEDYYDGMTLKDIQKKHKLKNQVVTRQRVWDAKKTALKNLLNAKGAKLTQGAAVAERTIVHAGRRRTIFLTPLKDGSDFVWTLEDGSILPIFAQKILDEDPDFKEWDLIYL